MPNKAKLNQKAILTKLLNPVFIAFDKSLTSKKSYIMEYILKPTDLPYLKDLKINSKIEGIYLKYLNLFIKQVETNHNFDLGYLKRNLKTLNIRVSLENYLSGNNASYWLGPNEIATRFNTELSSIFHELFHCLSTHITEDADYSGFSIGLHSKKFEIGNGINEGYTELLTKRYLLLDEWCYKNLVFLVSKLELIVGKNEMEYLYSKGSLYGLVDILKKYNTETEILNFIHNMDLFLKWDIFDAETFNIETVMPSLIYKIINFLVISYAKKIYLRYENGFITYQMYHKKVKTYIKDIYNYFNLSKTTNIELKRRINIET